MHTSLKLQTKISQPGKRQHLKHPIPVPIAFQPIGKTLTNKEWVKFCSQELLPKSQHYCERKGDGSISFLGEGSIDALIAFQKKFKNRFHFRMICSDEQNASRGIELIGPNHLIVEELRYKDDKHHTVTLCGPSAIQQFKAA